MIRIDDQSMQDKLNDVDPLAYLTDVLTKIINGHPNSDIDQHADLPTPRSQSRGLRTTLTLPPSQNSNRKALDLKPGSQMAIGTWIRIQAAPRRKALTLQAGAFEVREELKNVVSKMLKQRDEDDQGPQFRGAKRDCDQDGARKHFQ